MSKLAPTPRSITSLPSFDVFEEADDALSRSLPADCCTVQSLNDYCHFYSPPMVRERFCLKELDRLFHHPRLITIMRSQEDHALLQQFLDFITRTAHCTPSEWFSANGKYHASYGGLCMLQSDFATLIHILSSTAAWSEFNTKHLFHILTCGESTEIMTMTQFLLALKKDTQSTEQIWKLNSTAEVVRKLHQIMSEQGICIAAIHKQVTPTATKKLQQLHELQVKTHQHAVSPRAYITNTELHRILVHLLHLLRLQQGSTVALPNFVDIADSTKQVPVSKLVAEVEIPKVEVEFTIFSPTDFTGKEQFFSEEIKSIISTNPQHVVMPSHDPNVFELTNGNHRKWSYSDLTTECNQYEIAAKEALNRRLFLHIDTSSSFSTSSGSSPLSTSRSRVSSAVGGGQYRKSVPSLPSLITTSSSSSFSSCSPSRANSILSTNSRGSNGRASSARGGTRLRRCSSPLPAVMSHHVSSGSELRRDLLRRSLT